MDKTPGCPLNNFAPCKKKECKFYFPAKRPNDIDCAILGSFVESMEANNTIMVVSSCMEAIKSCIRLPEEPKDHAQAKERCLWLKNIYDSQGYDDAFRERVRLGYIKARLLLGILEDM